MDLRDSSLTITSRAETAFCGLEEEFTTMYCRRDFERMMRKVRESSGGARATRTLPALYKMFDTCGIDYEENRKDEYYEKLIEDNISAGEYDEERLEDIMTLALFNRFNGYSTPSEYMDRLMVRLQKAEDQDKWSEDSLRLRILKQFVKYGNYLEDAGYGSRPTIEKYVCDKIGKKKKELTVEDMADSISEDIFEEYDNLPEGKENKNDRKPKGKHGLLKLCDDLATGKFRSNGGTKKSLYMLAMVLDMKLSGFPGATKENDIIKNLFRDYYNNNLMRYMTDAYKGSARKYENPSGQGINFKNYSEMVYLHYIVKDELEPQEKIKLSSEMIEELSRIAKDKRSGGKKETKDSRQTEYYRRHFIYKDSESGTEIFSEDILGMDDESFKKFLLDNYDCDTGTGETFNRKGVIVENTVGAIQIDTDQNTAFSVYKDIIAKLEKELQKHEMKLEECNYGLWFIDVAAYRKEGLQTLPDRHKEISRNKFDEFIDVLLGANSFIGWTVNESESNRGEDSEHTETSKIKIDALSVSNPKDVTRTSILVAYYYYFNVIHEDEDNVNWSNYGDLFEEFKRGIDPELEKCGYQEISGKCMFDVVLTFSSYARIVL